METAFAVMMVVELDGLSIKGLELGQRHFSIIIDILDLQKFCCCQNDLDRTPFELIYPSSDSDFAGCLLQCVSF